MLLGLFFTQTFPARIFRAKAGCLPVCVKDHLTYWPLPPNSTRGPWQDATGFGGSSQRYPRPCSETEGWLGRDEYIHKKTKRQLLWKVRDICEKPLRERKELRRETKRNFSKCPWETPVEIIVVWDVRMGGEVESSRSLWGLETGLDDE